jgi:hypothetical protein
MPETFCAIVKLLLMDDPWFGTSEATDLTEYFDSCFAAYYSEMEMEVAFATRQSSDTQTLPLIRRGAIHNWLRKYIAAFPNDLWHRLNIILRDVPTLIDPLTETHFEHTVIPRSSFPSEESDVERSFVNKAIAGYNAKVDSYSDAMIAKKKDEERKAQEMKAQELAAQNAKAVADQQADARNAQILAEAVRNAQMAAAQNAQMAAAQNAQMAAAARVGAAARMAQARINQSVREGSLALAGGWTKDENGKDVYVESSCIW